MKNLIPPLIALILTVGVVIPVFRMVQYELLTYHADRLTNHSLTTSGGCDYTVNAKNHPDSYRYLMKHANGTLKLCVRTLNENRADGDGEAEAYQRLANDAMKAMRLEPIENTEQWIARFKTKQSDLYAAFTKTE